MEPVSVVEAHMEGSQLRGLGDGGDVAWSTGTPTVVLHSMCKVCGAARELRFGV
jgi:hypothetical protein